MFPRHNEHKEVIEALVGYDPGSTTILTSPPLADGMSATEALYFWLGGFSDDPQYPLTGEGGPSFIDTGTAGDEILESRKARYEFDIERLGPRDDSGAYAGVDRFITYTDPRNSNIKRRINFWRYRPKGSDVPLVYFDVSRYKPIQYDLWAVRPTGGNPEVHAFKEVRSGVTPADADPAGPVVQFVEQGKYQILHPGLDDDWGSDFTQMVVANSSTKVGDVLRYPTGPFIGPIADTLTSFTDGTIEDSVEE
jgi:hypothetical protein